LSQINLREDEEIILDTKTEGEAADTVKEL
jgi:hypothetical protein